MAKIAKKSKTKSNKKTIRSVTLKSPATVQKTKPVGRVTSKTVTGVKKACKSKVSTNLSKPCAKATTPTVATVKKVKKSICKPKISPSSKRTPVQSPPKPQPPTRLTAKSQDQNKSTRRENPLEQKQISTDDLRAILFERRNGIIKNIDEEIDPTHENKIPVVVGDVVDLAQESSKNELSLHLAEVESRELGQIDKAIQKIGEGTYGVCEKCGVNISPARLKALPFANKCIRCQEEDERENF